MKVKVIHMVFRLMKASVMERAVEVCDGSWHIKHECGGKNYSA
jgi:hypothetical protein